MSVYSARITGNVKQQLKRLEIFQSEWTVGDDPLIKAKILDKMIPVPDLISLRDYGFKAIGWTRHQEDDGTFVWSCQCLKVTE